MNEADEIRYRRVLSVAKELSYIVRKDSYLFGKVSKRTKRWIKFQDILDTAAQDAKDEVLRLAKRKNKALAKLTRKEKELLGLNNPDYEEE